MNFADPTLSAQAQGHAAGTACPNCGAGDTRLFYRVEGVPTNSCLLFETREEALGCKRGEISLHFCGGCGFIFNAGFDPDQTEYSDRYEETQGFSPTFSRFHRNLAVELVERHGLRGREVMEIGCGKGEFLVLLSQLGENRGVGVDPSAIPERLEGVPGAERVRLIPEYFEPGHCREEPDFLCCKMTLEHIPDTADFIATIRAGLTEANGTVVFFQVPETYRILQQCAFEDIYHEHCSYFTETSLRRLFEGCGFKVTRTAVEYDDQYLTIEALPSAARSRREDDPSVSEIAELVRTFPERVAAHRDHWRALVRDASAAGRRVVLWGSGSKAVSFLTSLGLAGEVDCVTDINPNRHHHFMPGTGHRIVPPDDLAAIEPGLIVVMNRIYKEEIADHVRNLGLTCDIACL
ncbi:NDP-hexose methyltransferase [Novosphingobium endophyticum]|uniref:NDP-hexose methyltransferase n=1 Tax=Novosphingobium endophyticum TaxID=1955250 RepID=A0A916X6P5_9SPHN|nr:class I SAM-dependent methyltransferase [Novosphingobium endophyticum]GGC07774.1 NDP-hexose methyltransferase [Novosphingobium endophyticum]